MNFQSFGYLSFILALALLVAYVRDGRCRKLLLLAASLYFYSTFSYRFLVVLLAEAVYFHLCAVILYSRRNEGDKSAIKLFMVAVPLLVLAFYKYSNPFISDVKSILLSLGIGLDMASFLAPLGISFFTFQGISYVLDVDKRRGKPLTGWIDVLLYFSFFPHVLSGPIARIMQLGEQISIGGRVTHRRFREGVFLLIRGYAKKIIFADPIANYLVNPAFESPTDTSSITLVLGLIGYTVQIYMDLSGYTDIVRGSAKLVGFDLAENFNRPYSALTVSQFWQRWHQSMSGFFRDYLFHAVGGSRYGNVYVNLLITFAAIGVWHGAGWNFLVYGLFHGVMVGYERYRRNARKRRGLPELSPGVIAGARAWVLTFFFVVFSRILFRSTDLSAALHYLYAMMLGRNHELTVNWTIILVLAGLILSLTPHRISRKISARYVRAGHLRAAVIACVSLLSLLALKFGNGGFIYFRF